MCSSFFADGARHLSAHPTARVMRGPRTPRALHALAPRCPSREPLRLPQRSPRRFGATVSPARAGLGAASAGPIHAWALPSPDPMPMRALAQPPLSATLSQPLPPGASVIRVPLELLQAMRRAAAAEGRDEAAAWAEAAREWLAGRAHDDEPPSPTPAAAALPRPRASAAWAAIDALLADLRLPRRAA